MSYRFSFTPSIVRCLQSIERSRENIRLTILPPLLAEELRLKAFISSTHYSTSIEGNRLTLKETEQVIQEGAVFPARARDTQEVERYYLALQQVEKWTEGNQKVTDERVRKLHALLLSGKRSKPTYYRDGQNVIKASGGRIVYLPPESVDVPELMSSLVKWIRASFQELPVPVIAGVAHYQFVTIHPFYDGNGRTARLLATWILYQQGYDLGKFYSLEEFYAEDLQGYYNALITHPHHNYYFGRNEADITSWLEYFLRGMAAIFENVTYEVEKRSKKKVDQEFEKLLRPLNYRARRVLSLFKLKVTIQSADVASLLNISQRQSRDLLRSWVEQGWLEIDDPSRKGRKYRLVEKYLNLLDG